MSGSSLYTEKSNFITFPVIVISVSASAWIFTNVSVKLLYVSTTGLPSLILSIVIVPLQVSD